MRAVTAMSPRAYLRLAGVLYLIDFVTAGIAPVQILPRLIRSGDPVATADNIAHHQWMLHLAVAGDLVTVLCEVALCWLFYVIFKEVDRNLALVMALFRVIYTAMVGVNVLNLYTPLRLLSGDSHLTGFSPDQSAALATHSLDAYHDGFIVALLFFGVHILLLGVLTYRSGYFPRILGTWLVFASLGFLIYSMGNLGTGLAVPLLVVAPSAAGELALSVLMLFTKASRQPNQARLADAP
jgi:hypothetical protein